MMRLILIGDVGARTDYHAGDEAMLEALLDELRQRTEVDAVIVSGAPEDSAVRYRAEAIARIGFDEGITPTRAAREDRLERVTRAAHGHVDALPADDPAWQVIEAVPDADGVIIAGGGNLTTPFSEHVYERAALARIAAVFERPLVVTGQSLGPVLAPRDAELVTEILGSSVLVGVREAESARAALELGIPGVVHTIDDASFLVDPQEFGDDGLPGLPQGGYLAVSFPPYSGPTDLDDYASDLSRMLGAVVSETGASILFLPHQSSLDPAAPVADDLMHARLAAALLEEVPDARVVVAGQLTARRIAQLTRGAALSVSGRYHPIVFALSAAVPAIAVTVDDYTRRKIVGAMANFGVSEWALPSLAVASDDATAVILETWTRRAEIASHLAQRVAVERTRASEWWGAVVAALQGAVIESPPREQGAELSLHDRAVVARIQRLATREAGLTASVPRLREQLHLAAESAAAESRAQEEARIAAEERAEVAEARAHLAEEALGRLVAHDAEDPPAADDPEERYRAGLLLELESLEQQLFERERHVAFLAHRVHELLHAAPAVEDPALAGEVQRLQDEIRRAQETIGHQQSRIEELVASTSWKLTMPLRVVRNPAPYVRKLRAR
ncbi:hypothetical protein GSU68_03225 [Rathayibacter sp. VKM Ac-2759]|uniref:polysaccharide pyruvyl transferase family protein n=1 Tax=Rathayibacter sp. VKM Ac-2759 TaxID=2609252 RepID=UPI001318537D|nr:polysaccharide pyruvyl transferase family protein [Rathayibacter sp. VKM Ac-2759]QHC65689.1 hypothetical protein GSU68_03225 [Rathayibacter sp. VKM Ac-2759]